MGLLWDRESDLSEVQRSVLRVKDAARRREISPQEWPLAMVAYALEMSEDSTLLSEGAAAYADFVRSAPAEARQTSLQLLSRFITSRKGEGWRALLLYTLGEAQNPKLCARAASLVLTLAAPEDSCRFSGAAALVHMLQRGVGTAGMLGAVLDTSDLRLLPLLEPLYTLPAAALAPLLADLHTTLNSLSSAWLLQLLEQQPALAESITSALVHLAGQTSLVADLVYPIPTWAYTNPTPQPLHAWTVAEYLPRMRPRLAPHLSPSQMHRLEAAFS